MIYVVLPLYALSFGFDAVTVGVLLSVNRVVRILGYGWVAPLARAYGTNVLTAAACAAGALSTLAYGLLSGFVLAVCRAHDLGRGMGHHQPDHDRLCLW